MKAYVKAQKLASRSFRSTAAAKPNITVDHKALESLRQALREELNLVEPRNGSALDYKKGFLVKRLVEARRSMSGKVDEDYLLGGFVTSHNRFHNYFEFHGFCEDECMALVYRYLAVLMEMIHLVDNSCTWDITSYGEDFRWVGLGTRVNLIARSSLLDLLSTLRTEYSPDEPSFRHGRIGDADGLLNDENTFLIMYTRWERSREGIQALRRHLKLRQITHWWAEQAAKTHFERDRAAAVLEYDKM